MSRLNLTGFSLLLIASLLMAWSCAGGGGGSAVTSEARYEEGMDKAVDMSMGGEMAPMDGSNARANSRYDSQYRDQNSSFYMVAEDDLSGSETVIPADGLLASMEDWLIPKAWAQEHDIDQRYIVRNGNLEMEIEDFDKSAAEVRNVAERHGGIVTDSQMEKYGDNTRVGSLTLRIPSEKFDEALADLRELGDVKVQNVSSEDVSNQYIAGVSRMKSLRIEQETLQEMLADAREIQRSRGLGEAYSVLLDTQSRLSDVTTELQNVEDRINALADRITRSTIRVHLSERVIAPKLDDADWSIGATIERAKRDLQRGLDATASGIMYFLINGLVWWLIWILIIWLAWKLVLRRVWTAVSNALRHEGGKGSAGQPQ